MIEPADATPNNASKDDGSGTAATVIDAILAAAELSAAEKETEISCPAAITKPEKGSVEISLPSVFELVNIKLLPAIENVNVSNAVPPSSESKSMLSTTTGVPKSKTQVSSKLKLLCSVPDPKFELKLLALIVGLSMPSPSGERILVCPPELVIAPIVGALLRSG